MRFTISDETHTLASALRPELEAAAGPDELVACTHAHPLDGFVEVLAPSEAAVRLALLRVKDRVARARTAVRAADAAPATRAATRRAR